MRRGGDRERGRGRRAGCRRAHGAVVSVPEKISKRELGYVLFLRTNYPKVAFPTVPAKKKRGGAKVSGNRGNRFARKFSVGRKSLPLTAVPAASVQSGKEGTKSKRGGLATAPPPTPRGIQKDTIP